VTASLTAEGVLTRPTARKVLAKVAEKPGWLSSDLARALGIAATTAGAVLLELETIGAVARPKRDGVKPNYVTPTGRDHLIRLGLPVPPLREPSVYVHTADHMLTPGEVAALFRVDPKTVTRWASAGRIASIRTPGGHRRFREADVKALLHADDPAAGQ